MKEFKTKVIVKRLDKIIKKVVKESIHNVSAPAVGKTTWMKQEANKFLYQQFRELDIDNTLRQYQLKTCDEIANELISSLSNAYFSQRHPVISVITTQSLVQ